MTTFYLSSPLVKENALEAIRRAEKAMVVTVKKPTRSSQQNALMWALIHDLAAAKPEGRSWEPETWKAAMMHYLGHQVVFAEGLGGTGPFPMGFRSSKLSVQQMTDLIDCIYAYGTEHGVEWKEVEQSGFGDFLERSGA